MKIEMKKLIIFDMDGVLLNSEELYMKMNFKFFRELGATITEDEYQGFIGISATKMWEYIRAKANLAQSVEELKILERELKHQTLQQTELVLTDGIEDFLLYLKKTNHTIAIASSSLRKNIDLILKKLKLQHYFDCIVSGEDVTKGKPEPDIFLKVSNHYNYSPQDCVVIEDSSNGVKAAKAANMYCIGYRNPTSGNQNLTNADLIIDSFKEKQLYNLLI